MNKKLYFFVLIAVLIIFSCDPNTDIGDGDEQTDPTISTEVYKLQMNSDAFLTLVIDDINSDGKSTEGILYTYDGSSEFNDVSFLNESGDVIGSSWKVLSLTQIAPDYVIIVLAVPDATYNDIYLCRLSTAEMYLLNSVLSTNWWGCDAYSFPLADFAQRDDTVRTSLIMDGEDNLYTNAYGSMGSWQVVKIMLDEGSERISSEVLTTGSLSAEQFAVNNDGDIIFGDHVDSGLFAYRTISGDMDYFTPPVNHDFIRVFTGSDNQAWIVSEDNASYDPNLFRIDFSTATPSMVETTGISISAEFGGSALFYRDIAETTFYSNYGVTTVTSSGVVSTASIGTLFGSAANEIYKDKSYLLGTVDNDDSTTVVYIGDIDQETTSWISGYTGANYDVIQMNNMEAVEGSVFLSLEQTLSGNVSLFEVQSTGVVNSLSSLSQKQRVVSKVTLP